MMESFTATAPMLWSMLALVASVEVQVNVVELPVAMTSDDAEILTVGGWVTVMVTLSVLEPLAFIAVMV